MKISKVDHIRAGVGIRESETQGMLYHSPDSKAKNGQDVRTIVETLNRRAKTLYQVFNRNGSESGSMKAVCGILRSCMNDLVKGLLNETGKDDTPDQTVERQIRFLENLPEKKIFLKNTQPREKVKLSDLRIDWKGIASFDAVETLVYGSLKKSLNRAVPVPDGGESVLLPEVFKKILLALCSGDRYLEELGQIPEYGLRTFLRALNEDYTKEIQIGGIVKSIEQQDVRVQCVQKDGKMLLQLANADHPRKKYIFEFLKQYADNEEDRPQMLVHFRRLILLFYCGSEVWRLSEDADVAEWTFGRMEPEQAETFSEDSLELYFKRQGFSRKSVEYKKLILEMKETIRQAIAIRYRESVSESGLTEADRFWLQYIERQAESLLSHTGDLEPVKMSKQYLCKKTFSAWISYIGMKYIDMGKAVYHFAMPKGSGILTAEEFGKVLPEYAGGISSFDYERIKAEESLNRDIISAVSFAVSNFDRAARDDEARQKSGREDILQLLDYADLELRGDTARRLLQFFGGKTKWEDSYVGLCEGKELACAFGKELARLRNAVFHYTGEWNGTIAEKDRKDREIIEEVFDLESEQVSSLIRKKYYANNALMFYSRDKVDGLIVGLYAHPVERPAQIPAFGRILNKAGLKEFDYIKGNPKRKLWSSSSDSLAVVGKFENCLLFFLKEIYYYAFLPDKSLKSRFLAEIDRQTENVKATENLKARIRELDPDGSISFGELCQGIMTDYTLQNKGMRKLPSEDNKNTDKQIYKHFRSLLYIGIRKAFRCWLSEKEEIFGFLRSPQYSEHWQSKASEQEFCTGGGVCIYDHIREKAMHRPILLSWYTMSHFLNQRQLNHLIGSVKNYIVLIYNIDARAESTGNCVNTEQTKEQADRYEEILDVLDFSRLFCEQLTNKLEDYFTDEEEYGEYLSRYVAWKKDRYPSLKDFCGQKTVKGCSHPIVGVYYDGDNPVINRNVILSRMYGNEKLLAACLKDDPVTKTEILDLYRKEAELQGKDKKGNTRNVFKEGYCETEEEQKKVRDFQNRKNRIELLDIMFLSELTSDLMSQLRAWAYVRERDLMYCQLGIHYIGLQYGAEAVREPWMDALQGYGISIKKGAVLYQILAMNTYHLPVYGRDADDAVYISAETASAGKKVSAFYKDYCRGDESVYNAGLCFFENLKEHDVMVDFRNSIDHFKYEATLGRSILSLYSEMFDRFLKYDPKLQKSVPVMLKNILLRHFVIADFTFGTTTGTVTRASKRNPETTRKMVDIRFRPMNENEKKEPVRSDVLTYRLNRGKEKTDQNNKEKHKGEEVMVEARSKKFISLVKNMMEYSSV